MKRSWKCPKCNGTKIGYLDNLYDSGGAEQARSRTLQMGQEQEGGIFSQRHIYKAEVEAFICTECGYFEEYVREPEKVRWDKLPFFRWCTR